jgi:signal transduction histidine kinase/ActR/RegA family two-component response regulator
MGYLSERLYEFELPFVVALVLTAVLITGLTVWLVMKKTVIRRKDEELERARENAGLAVTARNRFLANISHELLNPISTIVGMNEMAMRENAEDVPKPYYTSMMNYCFDIRDSSEQLISLINNLLYMSDIESGRIRTEEQEYDTREMLRSVIKKIRSRCDDKGLSFEVAADETLPGRMYGDTGKLRQILTNLLTNAVKYTEVGGIVFSVSVTEREDALCKLRFSVKDTGHGVKSDEIGKIFKAYESLDEKKDSRRGIGLGLDISRRFAELMGGTLTCESEYGKGSEFILTITQKIADQTPAGDLNADEQPAARGRYVPQFIAPDADILVVDSSARSVEIIRKLLRETNVFVSSASRIADGLEKIKDTRFNVMLIDQVQLDTDEDEIIGRIRETDPLLPVYIMTSSSVTGETDYVSKGYTGYISKPVDGVILETIIFRHIPEQMRQAPDIAGEKQVKDV